MGTSLEQKLKQEVRRILEAADLDSVTERNIKGQVAKKFGDAEPYKDVIRVSIRIQTYRCTTRPPCSSTSH